MTIKTMMAAVAVAVMAAGAAEAQDAGAGETLYQSVCKNCHGPTAKGMASYPRLSDKSVEYLTDRLERYRAGEKIGFNSPLMIPHAKNLSDGDIANVAAYITSLQ